MILKFLNMRENVRAKWLLVSILAIASLIIFFIIGGIHIRQIYRQTLHTGGDSPMLTYSSTPSSPPLELPAGWQKVTVDEYKFQIGVPPGWQADKNVSKPLLGHNKPQQVINLHSARLFYNREQESVWFNIAVYDKPPVTSLSQWLSKANPDMAKAATGDISMVLTKAYGGEKGIVSYTESKIENMQAIELGTVGGGVLDYTTYITQNKLKHIYAIELILFFHEKGAEPSDTTYVELFKELVSTFSFTD